MIFLRFTFVEGKRSLVEGLWPHVVSKGDRGRVLTLCKGARYLRNFLAAIRHKMAGGLKYDSKKHDAIAYVLCRRRQDLMQKWLLVC